MFPQENWDLTKSVAPKQPGDSLHHQQETDIRQVPLHGRPVPRIRVGPLSQGTGGAEAGEGLDRPDGGGSKGYGIYEVLVAAGEVLLPDEKVTIL